MTINNSSKLADVTTWRSTVATLVEGVSSIIYGGLLYRPMKKKVKGEGWLTGLSQ